MKRVLRLISYAAALIAPLTPTIVAAAPAVIAHRGVFHDVDSRQTLPENSYDSVVRAYKLGLSGVELDLRLDSSGDVLIVHDFLSGRSTEQDNYAGKLNAVDVLLKNQGSATTVHFAEHDTEFWRSKALKAYGRGATVFYPSLSGDGDHVQSLYSMLKALWDNHPEIMRSNFMIVLDVQDATVFSKAAQQVRDIHSTANVYLKFFVHRAIAGDATASGANTCYDYEKSHGLLGVKIIPQINDGELDITEDDDAGIEAFGTKYTINDYLTCWANAAKGSDGAEMPIVSASVPANNADATNAAYAALQWAANHDRRRMSIVPNPDAGRTINGTCTLFQFRGNDNAAAYFNTQARTAKTNFADKSGADFIVWDVMGDVGHQVSYVSPNKFDPNLC